MLALVATDRVEGPVHTSNNVEATGTTLRWSHSQGPVCRRLGPTDAILSASVATPTTNRSFDSLAGEVLRLLPWLMLRVYVTVYGFLLTRNIKSLYKQACQVSVVNMGKWINHQLLLYETSPSITSLELNWTGITRSVYLPLFLMSTDNGTFKIDYEHPFFIFSLAKMKNINALTSAE